MKDILAVSEIQSDPHWLGIKRGTTVMKGSLPAEFILIIRLLKKPLIPIDPLVISRTLSRF